MTEHSTVLGGRYQLDQVIGRGGMAEVWRARDLRLGRDVAVKRLRVDLATDPTFQARFQREAQSAAGLNHPNIVATYDTGEEPDEKTGIHVPYIVMELVEGHTLRDLLRADRRILPEKALEWTQGVLDALNYSHRAGIIHRDIKPANVMLTPGGHVKVMDFGIARAVADTSATMTQTAAVIGTAQYLSPEQARGETVDSRSDIYSAGCLLYELLAGRPPFVGESPVSVAYQHVREAPLAPSTLDPELTPAMDAITLKSLAKDPADRYQSAKQMRDDIARLLAGQPVQALDEMPTALQTTAMTPVVGAATPRQRAAQERAGQQPTGFQATGQDGATAQTAVVGQPTPAAGQGDAATGQAPLVAAEEPRRRSPLGWIIALLLAALVLIGGWSAYSFLRPATDDSLVSVPSVRGQNETAATAQLQTAGLSVKATHVAGDEKTENQVIDQDPKGGARVARASTVTITINDGPQTNKIPTSLIGMDEKQARAALVKAGFVDKLITVTDASADQENQHLDFVKGQIVQSNPAPGADVVPATQKVVLYRATGRSVVPNLQGLSRDEATTAAKAAGFSIVFERTETTEPAQADKVVQQDPRATSTADRTEPITVSLGQYATPSPTPTKTPSTTAPVSPPPSTPTPTKTATSSTPPQPSESASVSPPTPAPSQS